VTTSRVRIGTCRDAGEAALIRAVLTAHEIRVFISGENRAMTLGLGMGIVEQVIWVDAEDAADAAELLHEMREGGTAILPEDEVPEDDASEEREDEVEPGGAVIVSSDYAFSKSAARRKIALALLVGVMIGFGTAHMSIRAWWPAACLAFLELCGWILVFGGDAGTGALAILGAIVCDIGLALMKITQKTSSIAPAVAIKKG
jgi:hypothetical protein